MTVKRIREDREVEALAMANCLKLLSNMAKSTISPPSDRVFACKTCNRQFSSFQALGGHRTSHKRTRVMVPDTHDHVPSPAKSRTHECSICGLEFPLGQALGGYMRRHRNDHTAGDKSEETQSDSQKFNSHNDSHDRTAGDKSEETQSDSEKSNSHNDSHRALLLDLNLTPYENDLNLGRLDN